LKWSSLKFIFRMEDEADGKRHTAEEMLRSFGGSIF
jgi:hypothetical protein